MTPAEIASLIERTERMGYDRCAAFWREELARVLMEEADAPKRILSPMIGLCNLTVSTP